MTESTPNVAAEVERVSDDTMFLILRDSAGVTLVRWWAPRETMVQMADAIHELAAGTYDIDLDPADPRRHR